MLSTGDRRELKTGSMNNGGWALLWAISGISNGWSVYLSRQLLFMLSDISNPVGEAVGASILASVGLFNFYRNISIFMTIYMTIYITIYINRNKPLHDLLQ